MNQYDRLTVDGLSMQEQAEVDFLWSQLRRARPRNLLRTAYYESKNMQRQIGSVVPPQYHRLGAVLGWTGKAVDSLARRCTLEDVYWPEGDLGSLGYADFRDGNHLQATIKAAAVKSLQHGVSWLVNTRGGPGEPESLVHLKDALNGTGRWSARTRSLQSFLSVSAWHEDRQDRPAAFTLYLDGLTIQVGPTARAALGVLSRQDHPWGVPVEPMVFHPWARDFGASRITRPMMGLQDRAVAAVVRMEAHMDIYAIPDMWLLGADMSLFRNADGTQKAAWQVMMGRVKAVPDDDEADPSLARADVKQFPAQSPAPHLAAINGFAKMFAREADLPDAALAITDLSNPTSADGYIESREGLIAEAEGATDDWTLPVRRAVARGLAIQNGLQGVPASFGTLTPRWRPPVFTSRAAAADAGMKQLAAVPWLADTEVGLELLGLTPDQIRRAQADRRRVQGRSILERIAPPDEV